MQIPACDLNSYYSCISNFPNLIFFPFALLIYLLSALGLCVISRRPSYPYLEFRPEISISNNSTRSGFVSVDFLHAMRIFLALNSLVAAVLAASRTSPPSGSLTVGSGGTYSTVSTC